MAGLLLLLAGCDGVFSSPPEQSTIQQRLEIPPAEPDNILTRAIAMKAVGEGWVMVPASEFYAKASGLDSEDLDAINTAFTAGQHANDPWTSGAITKDVVEKTEITSRLWLVVNDARLFDGTILTTDFTLVPLTMTWTPSWAGMNLAFTIEQASIGTGRCCGPNIVCESGGGAPPGGCPSNGYCGDAYFSASPTGAVEVRPQAGGRARAVTWYTEGVPSPGFCQPALIPGCGNVTQMCNGFETGANFNQTWEASLPLNNASCSAGDRPVQGRNVPPQCLYANETIACIGCGTGGPAGALYSVGRGGIRPECDGHCRNCESNNQPTVPGTFMPRQCQYMTAGPDTGGPPLVGPGVCGGGADVIQNQLALAASVGYTPGGPPVTGGCTPSARGVEICTQCSDGSCRRVPRRTASPIATIDCNTSTGPACPSGSGGGSGGGGSSAQRPANASQSNAGVNPESPPPPAPTPPPAPAPNGTGMATASTPATPSPTASHQPVEGADPIELASGSFTLSQTDLSFPGASRPLEFRRSYDSRSSYRSPLGSNWTHNWDVRLVPINDFNRPSWVDPYCAGSPLETTCLMLYVGGTPRVFSRDVSSGVFVPQAGVMASIIQTSTGWQMDTAEQHILKFDADGYLVQDVDRLGHGFVIDWEATPAGRLFSAVCPQDIHRLDVAASAYVYALGPVYAANAVQCVALGGMVGLRSPIQYDPADPSPWNVTLPQSPPAKLVKASSLLAQLQSTNGRRTGSGLPWGNHLKRVRTVREIKARDASGAVTATGRSLNFEYWPDDEVGVVPGSSDLPKAGLLKAVHGPAGTKVEYGYGSPQSAGHPAWLNEAFLTSVTRSDAAPGEPGLAPTPTRSLQFVYAWTTNAISASDLNSAENRYRAFLEAQVGCTYNVLNRCGQPVQPAFTRYTIDADVANYVANLRSQVADNIIRVENHGVVESETRYEVALFSPNFDKATRQRWGSSDVPPTPLANGFTVTLPEATLDYPPLRKLEIESASIATTKLPV